MICLKSVSEVGLSSTNVDMILNNNIEYPLAGEHELDNAYNRQDSLELSQS